RLGLRRCRDGEAELSGSKRHGRRAQEAAAVRVDLVGRLGRNHLSISVFLFAALRSVGIGRHCERSEAIQRPATHHWLWIASSAMPPRNDTIETIPDNSGMH